MNDLKVIDLYEPLSKHPELFSDNLHPNEEGAKLMAEVIAKIIKVK